MSYEKFQAMSLDHIKSLEQELLNNWKKEPCFVAGEEFQDGMAMIMVVSRDGDALERSNALVIGEIMSPLLGEDVLAISTSHWACGWLDGYLIKVFRDENADGLEKYTIAFLEWCLIKKELADYPVLSDEKFSEVEQEECIEVIESLGRSLVSSDAPDDWKYEVYSYIDPCDGPEQIGEEEVKDALLALGWLEEE